MRCFGSKPLLSKQSTRWPRRGRSDDHKKNWQQHHKKYWVGNFLVSCRLYGNGGVEASSGRRGASDPACLPISFPAALTSRALNRRTGLLVDSCMTNSSGTRKRVSSRSQPSATASIFSGSTRLNVRDRPFRSRCTHWSTHLPNPQRVRSTQLPRGLTPWL